jgi:hypothetical protein
MPEVTIHFDPKRTDMLRHICFYEFMATDDLWQEAENHYKHGGEYPRRDVAPLQKRLSYVATAKQVLDQLGWQYGEPPKVEQITADSEWLSKALDREWDELMDPNSGGAKTTDDMRRTADAADFLAGILDEIGWPEDKAEPEKVEA